MSLSWSACLFSSLLIVLVFTQVCSNTQRTRDIHAEIWRLVQSGRLSAARWAALQHLHEQQSTANNLELRMSLAFSFVSSFENAITSIGTDDYFDKLYRVLQQDFGPGNSTDLRRNLPKPDYSDCVPAVSFFSEDPTTNWDDCCSILPQDQISDKSNQRAMDSTTTIMEMIMIDDWSDSRECGGCAILNLCCHFFVGSSAHLRLPALHEPALAVRVKSSSKDQAGTLYLEQDGYLRLFDVAGILWPSGYLLAVCVANPTTCGIQSILDRAWSVHYQMNPNCETSTMPFAIELGVGVGAPSISLALYLQQYEGMSCLSLLSTSPRVVATDVATHALALTMSNAWHNGAHLAIKLLNYTNIASVENVRAKYFPSDSGTEKRYTQPSGFAVVMGASLQSFFQDSQDPSSILWKTLGNLLDKGNPHAVAIMVHLSTDPLVAPTDGSFELLEKVSGDRFGMLTRDGDSSDFEVVIFRRRVYEGKDDET